MPRVNLSTALLDNLDASIREGEKARAKQTIVGLSHRKISRPLVVRLASLARRAEIPQVGIFLLGKWVRPSHRFVGQALPEELAEYAACLIRIGAHEEAFAILNELDGRDLPQVNLYKAFGFIAQWDYAGVIPVLEDYLGAVNEPYERRIAQVNLAAAYTVVGSHSKASQLLSELEAVLADEGHRLLYNATLEIQTRLAIAQKDWSRAKSLSRKVTALSASGELHSLFAKKWQAYIQIRERGDTPETRENLSALREFAQELGNVETVRECDWFRAICCKDPDALAKVYFGTPYPAYRAALLKAWTEWGPTWTPPDQFIWRLKEGKKKTNLKLDLVEREWKGENVFVLGEIIHRFGLAMTLDFYRPIRLAELHSQLYPNEFYNPVSSANRIHQAIHRWREFTERHSIPIEVDETKSNYYFHAKVALNLVVPLNRTVDVDSPLLTTVSNAFGSSEFSITDLAQISGSSTSTAYRWVLKALKNEWVTKEGSGKGCRYRIRPSHRSQK